MDSFEVKRLEDGGTDPDRLEFDRALRPRRLREFIGQQRLRGNLEVAIRAARQRKEPLDHILFCGPPGLGKTTLAFLLAQEMDSEVIVSSGPALSRPKDLAGTLSRLEYCDILFIDEIHRVPHAVCEFLYSAMEDHAIDLTLDDGPGGRTLRLGIAAFTLVGATTREGLLSPPFRSRFGMVERLETYPLEDLIDIIDRAATLLGMKIDADARPEIARRSRGVPRVALRLQRRLRDLAQVRGLASLDLRTTKDGLAALAIDERGLEAVDRELLLALIERGGGPVGIKTLSACLDEAEDTIQSVYEPYLLRIGFLSRTPRGRVCTKHAYKHLGLAVPENLADVNQ